MLTRILNTKANFTSKAKIIDGKAIALNILNDYKTKIESLNKNYSIRPGLAIVQVGDRHESNIYIRNKLRVASQIGIDAKLFKFDENYSKHEIIGKINELNSDNKVNGIIVQLPVDSLYKFNHADLTNSVLPEKDVDCLNDENSNKIANGLFKETFIPCTGRACIELIELVGLDLNGKNIVIVGASKLVGQPLYHLLNHRNLNVSLCNDQTQNLKDICRKADLLVVAIGCSRFISGDFIKNDAVVIDVGINYDEKTRKIRGDVNFEEAVQKASFITPVPGGVGPLTVCMLMINTYESALKHLFKSRQNKIFN